MPPPSTAISSDAERDKLHAVIKQRFNLDDAATDELVAAATEAEQKAIDLYQFTARLNRSLDKAGRARMVEMMWQIVYADGVVTEFEDNLIWRAADLLGISREERLALRERVMARRASGRSQAMSGSAARHRDHRRLGRHRRGAGARVCAQRP